MTNDFHDLYNAKLFPKEQKIAVDKFIDETAANAEALMKEAAIPDYDIGLGERLPKVEAGFEGKPVAFVDEEYVAKIREELTEAAEEVTVSYNIIARAFGEPEAYGIKPGSLKDLLDAWFDKSSNEALQGFISTPQISFTLTPFLFMTFQIKR